MRGNDAEVRRLETLSALGGDTTVTNLTVLHEAGHRVSC